MRLRVFLPGFIYLLCCTDPGYTADVTLQAEGIVVTLRQQAASGVQLVTIGDSTSPGAFTLAVSDNQNPGGDLWQLEFRDPASGTLSNINPSQNDTTFNFTLTTTSNSFTAVWSDLSNPVLGGDILTVTVHGIIPPTDPVLALTLDLAESSPVLALHRVRFPRVAVGLFGSGPQEFLTFPYLQGALLQDPAHNIHIKAATPTPHPGFITMPWFAYYDQSDPSGPFFFYGVRDATGYTKQLLLRPSKPNSYSGPDGLFFSVWQIPENDLTPRNSYTSPYPVVLSVGRGDWYEAARLYRDWALRQSWATPGRLAERLQLSAFIREPDILSQWAGDGNSFQYFARDVADQQTLFKQTHGMGHFVFGWHNNQFDHDLGAWFPIKPSFITATQAIAAAGHAVAPYFINLVYTTSLPNYSASDVPGHLGQSVAQYTCHDEQGAVRMALGMPQDDALLDMGTPFPSDYTNYVATRLRDESGARGIYLDVFGQGDAELCYGATGFHPNGGGNYFNQGKVALVKSLAANMRASDPDYVIYSEFQSDYFVGLIDATLATGAFSTDPATQRFEAPLFQTVYHDYHTVWRLGGVHGPANFLTPDGLRLVRRIYAADTFLGRRPEAGGILIANSIVDDVNDPMLPGYDQFIDYINGMIDVLRPDAVRAFVARGETLPPPDNQGATIDQIIDPVFGPDKQALPFTARQPLTYLSAWRDPRQKGVGLLFTNWTQSDDVLPGNVPGGQQQVPFSVDLARVGLPAGDYALYEFKPAGATAVKALTLDDRYDDQYTVAERGTRFFVLAPAPKFRTLGTLLLTAGVPYTLTLPANVIQGAPVNFSTNTSFPAGASFDSEQGQLQWTPSDADAGQNFPLTFALDDGLFQDQVNGTLAVRAPGFADPRGLAGLWFDPNHEGEGVNVIRSAAGMLVFFYGYTVNGERLWLLSDVFTDPITPGTPIDLTVYDAVGGTFASPKASADALRIWGALRITFDRCDTARITLAGSDGVKTVTMQKLAGISGLDCSAAARQVKTVATAANTGLAGLWFDPALEGEGYNLIVSDAGTVAFFYGYSAPGQRLWLISDLLTTPLTTGADFTLPVFAAQGGVFRQPRPSADALQPWGELTLNFGSCTQGQFTLTGRDGSKTAQVSLLAGISGTQCPTAVAEKQVVHAALPAARITPAPPPVHGYHNPVARLRYATPRRVFPAGR